jgi:hypothetical protein
MGLELNKENARLVTGAVLILANLMPLAGVLVLGWEVGSLLWAYWLESAVVGFFNILKMAQAERSPVPAETFDGGEIDEEDLRRLAELRRSTEVRSPILGGVLGVIQEAAKAKAAPPPAAVGKILSIAKVPLILFFLVHYGLFMAGHAFFLASLFGVPSVPVRLWLLTTFLLFTSHGVSYLVYFIGRGEYRAISPSEQMVRPYGRIFLMQATIIFGGMLIQAFQAPVLALALLVGLKITFDLGAHYVSHARFERAAAGALSP